jgi:hypothetical protein
MKRGISYQFQRFSFSGISFSSTHATQKTKSASSALARQPTAAEARIENRGSRMAGSQKSEVRDQPSEVHPLSSISLFSLLDRNSQQAKACWPHRLQVYVPFRR